MTIIALYSNKGGVGKTAAAVNLAYLAAREGHSTLLCDLDAQGAASYYFRVKPKLKRKARGLAVDSKAVEESIKSTNYDDLDILPADLSNRNLDVVIDKLKHRRRRLKDVLDGLQDEYRLIFIDCPPTINVLAENIFVAADYLFSPLIPTVLSIQAHRMLLEFARENEYATHKWRLFFTMVDRRKKMHELTVITARQEFHGVLRSAIPYLSQVEQMGVYREPVPAFAPKSAAAQAYQGLWDEIKAIVI